jgi:tetratricopeptide (TPR) repeat protein
MLPRVSLLRVAHWLGLVALTTGLAACGHHGPPPPAGPSRALLGEAARIGRIAYEDDFQEARLVLQALPAGVPERQALRLNLLHYLLDPVLALKPEALRRDALELENDDAGEQVLDSFRDALGLYDPTETWNVPPRLSPAERALLEPAAKLVVAIFSPQGAQQPVTLATAVLATLAAGTPEAGAWNERLDELVRWTDEAGANAESATFRRIPGALETLEAVLADWPTPAVVERLDALYTDRQKKFSAALRHPVGGGESARRALGELLLAHGDEMQRGVLNLATLYLRAGAIELAAKRAAALAGDAGDDPDLRALLDAAAKPTAGAPEFLALARRFLPRVEQLGGTSTDTADPLAAFRVLEAGLARAPGDVDLLLLTAHVARAASSYFLAIRHLEEAAAVLEKAPGSQDAQARISAELMELYFLRLRLRLDPERDPPAFAEADVVRGQFAHARERFKNTELKLRDADIDFEVGRSYVNAGQIDKAEPAFLRARDEGEPTAEITTELSNLALKRGDPQRAAQILSEGLATMRAQAAHDNQPDTIGSVEGHARLERLLGDAYDIAGKRDEADAAWRGAVGDWERLLVEHLRRKTVSAAAEAEVELGRLLYLLGRHAEGLQKFDEAVEQDGDRDQTYIDTVAFLVQNGETDAAVAIYRRALARPSRAVSEYVRVYTSLWILDLTRRTNKTPDTVADAYLRTLDQRHGELRPRRGAPWTHELARFATGKVTYEQALAAADTVGKRAEIYFYEAMRRLGDGKSDDAQQLWKKVVDTRMFSFFEFDMASRYLRVGAPSAPTVPSSGRAATETI